MARMIPSKGAREHNPRSREGAIYAALETLDDSCTVVHSMNLVSVANSAVRENEADFILFNKDKGIICFEAKAGQITYRDGEWLYSDGRPMKHGGPFNQAQNIKFRLMDEMRGKGLGQALKRCKLFHTVWFPSITQSDISQIALPEEADKQLILTKDDLDDPSASIERILSLEVANKEQDLTEVQARDIIEKILCPEFHVAPTARTSYDFDDIVFSRLLESQINILNFLQEQRSAVINGVAGSGKTLIAVEQAKRMSARKERVLFLCYNKLLGEDIKRRCQGHEYIDVYTLDGFSYKICGEIDYDALNTALIKKPNAFPYKHIVIDEGQDFGSTAKDTSKSDLLDTLRLLTEEAEGTFYLFYDKFQLVQGSGLPDFINEADCKLTLWINCRNIFNIAKCSIKALDGNLSCKINDSTPDGAVPKMVSSCDVDEQIAFVDRYIGELKSSGLTDIVVLTCKTEESSIVSLVFTGAQGGKRWRNTGIPVYSCRRFKGLEADAVILVDVTADLWVEYSNDSVFKPKPGLIFYTGASRAKHELRIVCDMGPDDFAEVVNQMKISSKRNPAKAFAKQINALPDRS